MSFIASMVSAAVGGGLLGGALGIAATGAAGAGLGAGLSAATGGDAGEGALMGGIGGALAGGAGLAFAPAAAGAAAPATQVGTQAATQAGTQAAAQAGTQAATQAATQAGTQAATQAGIGSGTGLTTYGLGQTAAPLTGEVIGGSLASVPGGVSQAAVPFLDTLAGKAVTGAGIGALGGGITNPDDPLKGAAIGAGAGALGGYGAGALSGSAGAGGAMGAVGDFAAAHPMITSGLISVPTSMALNSMTAPDATPMPKPEERQSQFRWGGPNYTYNPATYMPYTPQPNVYKPTYFAEGGITDLDSYGSQAQEAASGGIMQIPNPVDTGYSGEYGRESVRMMAQGGISKLADSVVSSSPIAAMAGWEHASDLPLIGGLFNKPEDLPATATLTPEEKQKLMAMMAAQQGQQMPGAQLAQIPQQMAQGGIADLGGYAAGGRPNLLHGPGTGVSDDIPATIAGKQPARLAAGEYVVPSRIVSELGNGSTDAGAQRLDEMVSRVQAGRKKTMGNKKQFANDSKAYKHLPA